MKKIICVLFTMIVLVMLFAGCNMQVIDTTWSYEYAYIALPNGELIEGPVTSWTNFENENSDMIQVKIDGKNYFTHATNVVLVSE